MLRDDARRRDHGRDTRRRKARPGLEGLENRLLLYATSGGQWPHPNLITYSIVPDGTNIFGTPSTLGQAFNAKWSTATWENILGEAAATWEQVANINIVPVGDDGAPDGSGAYQQGDPGMGDIRISGLPSSVLGSGTLAFTILPPPLNGYSNSGDIVFNTSQLWQINSNYDLLTVAIHEFGHALGMSHSQISTADMYATYNGIKQSLTSDDTSGIQSIYGARQPDPWMAAFNNTTAANAINLTPLINSQGQVASFNALDIQTPTSAEWFQVTVPSTTTGSMVVTMQSTYLSMLSPGLQILNSSLQVLGYLAAPGAFGATVQFTLTGVSPGQVYYIATSAGGGGPTSTGNYGLLINFGSSPQSLLTPPVTTTATQPDNSGGGSGDSIGGHGGHGGHGGLASPLDDLLSRLRPGWWLHGMEGDALTVPGAPDPATPSPDRGLMEELANLILLIAPADSTSSGDATSSPSPGGPPGIGINAAARKALALL